VLLPLLLAQLPDAHHPHGASGLDLQFGIFSWTVRWDTIGSCHLDGTPREDRRSRGTLHDDSAMGLIRFMDGFAALIDPRRDFYAMAY